MRNRRAPLADMSSTPATERLQRWQHIAQEKERTQNLQSDKPPWALTAAFLHLASKDLTNLVSHGFSSRTHHAISDPSPLLAKSPPLAYMAVSEHLTGIFQMPPPPEYRSFLHLPPDRFSQSSQNFEDTSPEAAFTVLNHLFTYVTSTNTAESPTTMTTMTVPCLPVWVGEWVCTCLCVPSVSLQVSL